MFSEGRGRVHWEQMVQSLLILGQSLVMSANVEHDF